jgi:hypothetical protein
MESAGRKGEAAELEVDASAPNIVPAVHKVSWDGYGGEAADPRAEAVEFGAKRVRCEGVPVRCEIVPVVHKVPSDKPGVDRVALRHELFTFEIEAVKSGVRPANFDHPPNSSWIVLGFTSFVRASSGSALFTSW